MDISEFSKEDAPYREHGMAQKVAEAKKWIRQNRKICSHCGQEIPEMFEDVVIKYSQDDNLQRAFMFAWCDLNGGI